MSYFQADDSSDRYPRTLLTIEPVMFELYQIQLWLKFLDKSLLAGDLLRMGTRVATYDAVRDYTHLGVAIGNALREDGSEPPKFARVLEVIRYRAKQGVSVLYSKFDITMDRFVRAPRAMGLMNMCWPAPTICHPTESPAAMVLISSESAIWISIW